jgi:hypothetical protein
VRFPFFAVLRIKLEVLGDSRPLYHTEPSVYDPDQNTDRLALLRGQKLFSSQQQVCSSLLPQGRMRLEQTDNSV